MKLSHATLLVSPLFAASCLALPHLGQGIGGAGAAGDIVLVGNEDGGKGVGKGNAGIGAGMGHVGGGAAVGGGDAVGGGAGGEEVGAGEGEAGGEEAGEGEGEAEGDEVEQEGQFGEAIELGGGDIKTDTVFPPGVSGTHLSFSRTASEVQRD